jgi:mono/diheme cytochrome c family protein
MKNVLKGAVLVTLLSGGIFTVAANAFRPEMNTAAAISGTALTVQSQLYVSNCARCHGANGKGNTQLGQEMGVPDLTSPGVKRTSSKRMAQIISKGAGDMPGFGKKLKATQINSLVRYVKALK